MVGVSVQHYLHLTCKIVLRVKTNDCHPTLFIKCSVGYDYDYRSQRQHAKAFFGVLFGILYGIFFSKMSLNPLKIV